jgi:hypothetical protein
MENNGCMQNWLRFCTENKAIFGVEIKRNILFQGPRLLSGCQAVSKLGQVVQRQDRHYLRRQTVGR